MWVYKVDNEKRAAVLLRECIREKKRIPRKQDFTMESEERIYITNDSLVYAICPKSGARVTASKIYFWDITSIRYDPRTCVMSIHGWTEQFSFSGFEKLERVLMEEMADADIIKPTEIETPIYLKDYFERPLTEIFKKP